MVDESTRPGLVRTDTSFIPLRDPRCTHTEESKSMKISDDTWVDLGAQWVHGQNNNIAFELASPFGLLEVPPENTGFALNIFDSQGNQISTDVSERFVETFFHVEDSLDEDSNASNGSAGDYYTRV